MKPELNAHEQYTVAQVKAILKQWPKSLVMELDDHAHTLSIYKREPNEPGFSSATEAASFRKPTLFL